MPRLTPIALASLLLLSAGGAFSAPIYKWKDADGSVHYEDTRPPQAEVEILRAPVPYRGEAPQEQGQDSGGTTETPVDAAANADTRRQQLCEQNQAALAEAEAAGRMYKLDDKGNRVYLSEGEIANHIAELRAAVASTCTAAGE